MNDNVVECKDVSFAYEKDLPILSNINFQVKTHETIGLLGANGAGKSTLLRTLVGLETGFSGSVDVMGTPVNKKNLSVIRANTGYVFQDSENQMFMPTVWQDIAFAPQNYGFSEEETRRRVFEAMEMTGISHLADRQNYKLSGGEKKLAAIATVLVMKPEIILYDEPSISLDPKNRRNLIHIMQRLEQTQIIASHDMDMILDTCSRVILLSEGNIVYDGKTEDILKNKALLEQYGLELPLCYSRCFNCSQNLL